MAMQVAFGAYIPGSSLIHNAKAQVKIILACAFSISIFFIESWLGMLLIALGAFSLYKIARIPLKKACGGLVPLLFVLLMTVLCHTIAVESSDASILVDRELPLGFMIDADSFVSLLLSATKLLTAHQSGSVGILGVIPLGEHLCFSFDGLMVGIFFSLRIALVFVICALLTFTTSINDLLDGLRSLLSPLRRLGAPVEDICLVSSIALRFVPTITEEAYAIRRAQESRGALFEGAGLINAVKSWCSVLTPLFVRLFKRSSDIAMVLDARCYASSSHNVANDKSTKLFNARDLSAAAIGLVLCVVLGVLL